MPPGRPVRAKDSAPRNRRSMTDNERKLKAEKKRKEKDKASKKSKESFLQLMSRGSRSATEENAVEREETTNNVEVVEEEEIEVVNNNNYIELDGHVEEVEEEDGDDHASGVDTEVAFSYETASTHNDYLKKLKERVQKEISSECHALEEKWAISYLKEI